MEHGGEDGKVGARAHGDRAAWTTRRRSSRLLHQTGLLLHQARWRGLGCALRRPGTGQRGENTAACSTRHDSRQHFWRLGVSRAPNSSQHVLGREALDIVHRAGPRCARISIEAAAWLMQQPSPSNQACRIRAGVAHLQLDVDRSRRTGDCRPRATCVRRRAAVRGGTAPRSDPGYAPGRVSSSFKGTQFRSGWGWSGAGCCPTVQFTRGRGWQQGARCRIAAALRRATPPHTPPS